MKDDLIKLGNLVSKEILETFQTAGWPTNYFALEISVTGEQLKLCLIHESESIVLNLIVHHLDMPWHFEINYVTPTKSITVTEITNQDGDLLYEVYPKLFEQLDNLGSELARRIGKDVFTLYNEWISNAR